MRTPFMMVLPVGKTRYLFVDLTFMEVGVSEDIRDLTWSGFGFLELDGTFIEPVGGLDELMASCEP